MYAQSPELVVGLGADVRTPLAERLEPAVPTKAERRIAKGIRRMIAALPESGSVVIVHSPTVVGVYREMIREQRGPELAAATKVFSAPSMRDEAAVTRGLTLPIFIEPFVEAQREHRRALAQAWRL